VVARDRAARASPGRIDGTRRASAHRVLRCFIRRFLDGARSPLASTPPAAATRRAFVRDGALASLSLAALGGCEGRVAGIGPDDRVGEDGGSPGDGGLDSGARDVDAGESTRDGGASSDGGAIEWVVTLPVFTAGGSTAFDLATTLPAGVVRGGVYTIDPTGAALPDGMELSREGVLSVGRASAATMEGVVFAYEEP
jgi:hypothetical protein